MRSKFNILITRLGVQVPRRVLRRSTERSSVRQDQAHLVRCFTISRDGSECRIEEVAFDAGSCPMLISIPPKYSVAQIIGI